MKAVLPHCRALALTGLLALPLLLAGCAAPQPRAAVSGARMPAAPAYQTELELEGRLSVHYQQNGEDKPLHVGFRWTQSADRIFVTLISPLRQTLATLDVTPTEARLTEAGKPAHVAADIDTLTADTLGWTLPVAGLRGWLQGFSLDSGRPLPIAVPGLEDAPPVSTRDGWQIRYVSWHDEAAPPLTRPKRIDLQRRTEALGDMQIRIVIDRWQQP